MSTTWEVIYRYSPDAPLTGTVIIRPATPKKRSHLASTAGFILVALALGGFVGPLVPAARLEAYYWSQAAISKFTPTPAPLPPAVPVLEEPLTAPDGSAITPVNKDFSIIIPKIGVNAPVIADVDPTKEASYSAALLKGVAQSSTSFTPDQNGTTYIFSHSTNYDWFVKDLNAVFYLLKNLKVGDQVAVYYKGTQYIYQIRETKVVKSGDISYLVPSVGTRSLILETCWPPGSTYERLLLFADFVRSN